MPLKLIKLIIFLVCSNAAISWGQKTNPLYVVSGKIMQTSQYCGGARPSEEMLKSYETPRPYISKVLYIKAGVTNNPKEKVVLKFKSDSSGKFSFQLKPGTYCILQEEQVKAFNSKDYISSNTYSYDLACIKAWWKKPLKVITVKDASVKNLRFDFFKACFMQSDMPCITYTGPMPP